MVGSNPISVKENTFKKVLTEEMYSRQNSINEKNVISIQYTDSQNAEEEKTKLNRKNEESLIINHNKEQNT